MSEVIYCGQCGHPNPYRNKFCAKCGQAIIELEYKAPITEKSLVEREAPLRKNACPTCKQIDSVQKLSSIVGTGTRETSGGSRSYNKTDISGNTEHYNRNYSYVGKSEISGTAYSSSTTFISTTEKTNLAKKITPPSKPTEPKLKKYKFPEAIYHIITSIGIAGGIATAFVITTLFPNIIVTILSFIAGMTATILFLIQIETLIYKSENTMAQQQYEENIKTYNQEVDSWEAAIKRWEKMYYCHRDDVVFVEGESMEVMPSQTVAHAYKRILF